MGLEFNVEKAIEKTKVFRDNCITSPRRPGPMPTYNELIEIFKALGDLEAKEFSDYSTRD